MWSDISKVQDSLALCLDDFDHLCFGDEAIWQLASKGSEDVMFDGRLGRDDSFSAYPSPVLCPSGDGLHLFLPSSDEESVDGGTSRRADARSSSRSTPLIPHNVFLYYITWCHKSIAKRQKELEMKSARMREGQDSDRSSWHENGKVLQKNIQFNSEDDKDVDSDTESIESILESLLCDEAAMTTPPLTPISEDGSKECKRDNYDEKDEDKEGSKSLHKISSLTFDAASRLHRDTPICSASNHRNRDRSTSNHGINDTPIRTTSSHGDSIARAISDAVLKSQDLVQDAVSKSQDMVEEIKQYIPSPTPSLELPAHTKPFVHSKTIESHYSIGSDDTTYYSTETEEDNFASHKRSRAVALALDSSNKESTMATNSRVSNGSKKSWKKLFQLLKKDSKGSNIKKSEHKSKDFKKETITKTHDSNKYSAMIAKHKSKIIKDRKLHSNCDNSNGSCHETLIQIDEQNYEDNAANANPFRKWKKPWTLPSKQSLVKNSIPRIPRGQRSNRPTKPMISGLPFSKKQYRLYNNSNSSHNARLQSMLSTSKTQNLARDLPPQTFNGRSLEEVFAR